MRKRRKLGVLCVSAVLLAGAIVAQEGQTEKKLVIRLKNGKTVVYSLHEVESIQFDEGRAAESAPAGGSTVDKRSGTTPNPRSEEQPIMPQRLLGGSGSLNAATGPANLFDGNSRTGWFSRPDARFPHEFILEMPQSVAIGFVEFDNAGQEGTYPGSSARDVIVLASNVGPSGPYVKMASVVLARGANAQRFAVTPATVRWVRMLINSNYGHANYTQLMEVRFYPPSNITIAKP